MTDCILSITEVSIYKKEVGFSINGKFCSTLYIEISYNKNALDRKTISQSFIIDESFDLPKFTEDFKEAAKDSDIMYDQYKRVEFVNKYIHDSRVEFTKKAMSKCLEKRILLKNIL